MLPPLWAVRVGTRSLPQGGWLLHPGEAQLTTTIETLRKKAHDSVAAALGDDCHTYCAGDIANAVLDAVGFDAVVKERNALRDAVSAMHDFLNRSYRINGRCIELDCESHSQAWDDLHETRFIVRSALELQESKS